MISMYTRFGVITLVLLGCLGCVNRKKDFAMVSDGKLYVLDLAPAEGRYSEYSSHELKTEYASQPMTGTATDYDDYKYQKVDHPNCTVVFPSKDRNNMAQFVLQFDPSELSIVSYDITASDTTVPIEVQFFPGTGHDLVDRMTLIEYSSRLGDGQVQVDFEELDIQKGGRVKGTIVYAKLNGIWRHIAGAFEELPKEEKIFEIHNFHFDVTLDEFWVSSQDLAEE